MDGGKVYVDSSVVLRRLLEQPGAIKDWSAWSGAVASELTQLEALRTLDRLRVLDKLTASELADCLEELSLWTSSFEQVPIDRSVVRRASAPLPTPLGALDALHLATALLWMENNLEELTIVTHDRQLATAARASGLEVRT